MKAIPSKLFFSLIMAFAFFAFTGIAYACGPFFNKYIYMPEDSDTYHPLLDANALFDENYGLILSEWGPEYLYTVYMRLTGKKVSEETKKILLQYYAGAEPFFVNPESHKHSIEQWLETRESVLSDDNKIDEYARSVDGYNYYLNCLPHAFVKAKDTLEQRKQIYSQVQLVAWVKRQDEVFSHCGTPLSKKIILTEPDILSIVSDMILNISTLLPKNLMIHRSLKQLAADELLQYDNEYQDAAADFYKANFDVAEKKFRKIADNLDQPWRGYASLVIGRIYIRLAELGTVENYDDSEKPDDIRKAQKIRDRLYAKAEKIFNSILADKSLSEIHSGAQDLLNFVLYRIDPKKRLKIADDVLLTSSDPSEIINNMEDYSLLWNYRVRNREDEGERRDWGKFILRDGGDFTQWVYIWQLDGQDSLKFALNKYHKDKSLPWLLASLKHMTSDNPSRDQILRAAESVPSDSSAYLTANYYRIKLLVASGQKEEAKKMLENILSLIKSDALVRNYFNELRMSLADSFGEAIAYSLRNVVYVENDSQSYRTYFTYRKPDSTVSLLDKNIVGALNKFVPLKKWMDIILSNTAFTPEIRSHMGLIAFVRAVLLEDWKSALTMADFVASDPTIKKDLALFRGATTDEERKFASALFLLDYAGIGYSIDYRLEDVLAGDFSIKGVDNYRRNWWCGEKADTDTVSPKSSGFQGTWLNINGNSENEELVKKLIPIEDIKLAQDESNKIYANIAPNYLSSVVINHAMNRRTDPRVPRALHLAVLATRVPMCSDNATTELSRRAFQTLHNNYPNNYWANETPYWY